MTSQIRVDEITNRSGLGTVTIYDNGFEFTGVTTFTEDVDITGGLTIGGVLTYEDVTNIDSVGIITAQSGLHVTGGNLGVGLNNPTSKLHLSGGAENVLIEATNSSGDAFFGIRNGSYGILGTGDAYIYRNGGDIALLADGTSDVIKFATGGNDERLRIASDGVITGRGELRLTEGTSSVSNGDEIGSLMFTYPSNDNKNAKIVALQNTGTSGADLAFFTRTHGDATNTDGGTEKLRITSGGHVNIGGEYSQTDSKVTIVDVSRPIAEATLNLQSSTTSGAADTGPVLRFYGHSGSEGRYHASIKGAKESGNVGSTAAYLAFNTRPSGGGAMAERVRIDSVGNMGIGGAPLPTSTGYNGATLHLRQSANSGGSALRMTNGSTGHTTSDGFYMGYWQDGHLYFYNQEAGHMIFGTNSTERLRITSNGNIGMGGITSPSFTTGGGIHLKRNYGIGFGDGNNGRPDFQIATINGSSLDFRCGNGADTADISMTTSGNLVFANGGGIDFSATANGGTGTPSELLDDYEEGFFTPTIYQGADNGSGGAPTFAIQAGRYIKIGRKVHCDIYIRFASSDRSTGAQARIGNLPFAIANDSYGNVGAGNLTRGGGVSTYHDTTQDVTTCYGSANNTNFYLYKNGGTGFVFGGSNDANLSGKYWIGIFEYICTP